MERVEDRRRLEALYAAHAAAVLRYARARTSDVAEAEDVVMEVFVVACRRLDAVPLGAELPWLLGCARRVLANQRRGKRRAEALTDRLRDSLGSANIDPWTTSALVAAFGQLSVGDQEVLLLSAWEDLTPQELGVALGCSRTAAAVRLHRARRRLRRIYTASTDDHQPDRSAEVTR